MPAASLTELQQQIAQREQELQALREQLQARQSHLDELNRRKEQLQSDLRQIEEEIAALATTSAEQAAPAAPTVPPSPAPAARAADQPLLSDLIITLLRESTTPMTGRQLLEESQRRGVQMKTHDPLKVMENRLQILKSKGVIRRAKSQYGFILASSTNGAKKKRSTAGQPAPTQGEKTPAKPAKSEPAAKKSSGKGSLPAEVAKPATPGRRGGQPPLRMVLTGLLKKSHKPLSGSELAERALKAGYKTKSENFIHSVWSMLGQMENVEHLPQQGYRLKTK